MHVKSNVRNAGQTALTTVLPWSFSKILLPDFCLGGIVAFHVIDMIFNLKSEYPVSEYPV